ncbi:MAG: hypothetical protein JNJ83_20150 [Verrucomicrobiaceae bacterium]|nr:hypothetical protein [Verrucomicrobiaceae bacterium]
MKQHQILIPVLVILTITVGGWWAWKMKSPQLKRVDSVEQRPPSGAKAVAADQAPVPQPQAAKAPDAQGGAPRRFIDMPASERLDILDQIKATDADELLKLFLDAGRIDQDPMKQSMLQSKLVGALMEKTYAPDFITRMKRFVTDSSNSKLERGSVISAFASARTKEGAEFVLWVLANQTDMEMRTSAIFGIRGLGGSQPYLPAMIEPLWKESNDADLLTAVAEAMAREAAPSSIELLLPAAAAPHGKDDKRQQAALGAIPKIYRADAVPALESALKNSPPGSKMNVIALFTLGRIGDKSASRAVIAWLQDTDKSAAPLVADWISRASGVGQLPAAEAALNPSVPFRSEENREAIRAALSAQRASTTKIGPSK